MHTPKNIIDLDTESDENNDDSNNSLEVSDVSPGFESKRGSETPPKEKNLSVHSVSQSIMKNIARKKKKNVKLSEMNKN
jgi:hypothetical protein